MDRIDAMRAFVRLVEVGTFSQVAKDLRIKQSTVSKWLISLEDELQSQLLERTTRKQRLTEAGQIFYERAKEILATFDEAAAALQEGGPEPRGLIKVSAPIIFGRYYIVPQVSALLRRYQDLEIELILRDGYVNLLEGRFDVAIHFGKLVESSLRARSLGVARRHLVASPEYLERHGAPRTPADLQRHHCLLHTGQITADTWVLTRRGEQHRPKVEGRFATNDGEVLCELAREGLGIAILATCMVEEDLKGGRLVELLRDYELPTATIHALMPPNRLIHPRTRLFVDFLSAAFATAPRDP